MARLILLATAILAAGCGGSSAPTPATTPVRVTLPTLPAADAPGRHVLFLGNSLTYGHDVPELVKAMAAAGGVQLQTYSVCRGGASLEDHWNTGPSREILARGRWDVVVFQQGPSTQPDSQSNLKEWATRWADEARRHKAVPALYMVWPYQQQGDKGFDLVSQSYRGAAAAADARVFPAGEAWREATRRDPAVALCTADGLHATEAGGYLAALVITHGLAGVKPSAVPAKLALGTGWTFELPEADAAALRRAAEAIAKPDR